MRLRVSVGWFFQFRQKSEADTVFLAALLPLGGFFLLEV